MSQRSQRHPGWLLGAWILFAPGTPPAVHAHEILSDCPDCPRMVVIPAGTFTMGSSREQGEPARRKFEGPRHNVKVDSFAIGETEITRKQYAAFVDATKRPAGNGCFTYGFSGFTDDPVVDPNASWRNPAFKQADDHPFACISWQDAEAYAAWLTRKTGYDYRLPSEAEWEYAARAGTTSTFFWGDDEEMGCSYANGGDPSLLRAVPAFHDAIAKELSAGDTTARYVKCNDGSAFSSAVRRHRPDAFGLYDMIGNAWEMVADCWSESLPASGLAYVEVSCERHRVRGGSWNDYPEELRSARRSAVVADSRRNDGGFRLARTLSSSASLRRASESVVTVH